MATVIVALAGSATTFLVSANQSDAETARAASGFLRTQQKEAYAYFLSEMSRYRSAAQLLRGNIEDYVPGWGQDALLGTLRDFNDAVIGSEQAFNYVKLVASEKTREVGDRVIAASQDTINALRKGTDNALDDRVAVPVHLDAIAEAYNEEYPLIQEFTAAAREDLNVPSTS